MIKVVSVIFFICNITAIGCNLFGRLSLAKIFSVTGIHGLMQIICLSVFIEIIMETFELQTYLSKLKGGISAKLNFEKIRRLLKTVTAVISIVIWSIVFTISMNIYNFLFDWGLNPLLKKKNRQHYFEIGNILLFILIIYVSNLLQRSVGSLYGKEEIDGPPNEKEWLTSCHDPACVYCYRFPDRYCRLGNPNG